MTATKTIKGTIDVSNKEEANRLNVGLRDTRLRSLTAIVGILSELPADDRAWVLQAVNELINREV